MRQDAGSRGKEQSYECKCAKRKCLCARILGGFQNQSVRNMQSLGILLNGPDMIFFANLSQLLCIFDFCDRYFENHWLAVRNERALIARQRSEE